MSSSLMEKAEGISSYPEDRIPDEMKELLAENDVIFDVHCHVFNFDTVPDKFTGIRIPMTRKFLKSMERFLHDLIPWTESDPLSNIAYFVEIGRSLSISEIAEKLFGYYTDKKTIFCPLMMDMRPGIKGKQNAVYQCQLEDMKNLRNQFPDKLLPFVAIDPNNPNVEDIFLKAFSQEYNFFGIKIYPSLGYLPSNPRLMAIYEVCQTKGIPVTAHCGAANVHTSYRHLSGIEGYRLDQNNNLVRIEEDRRFLTRNSYAIYFNNPENWEPVLHKFPKLKLNLAHFGGDAEWNKFLNGKNHTWASRIMDLMTRYEHLYADFSYNISYREICDLVRKKMEDNVLIRKRTLYGSDYYMIVVEGHFRSIKIDFATSMGDKIMTQVASVNPKKFLFE
jgi:predicted TIM-barrel fold metal-dependent hydrolase